MEKKFFIATIVFSILLVAIQFDEVFAEHLPWWERGGVHHAIYDGKPELVSLTYVNQIAPESPECTRKGPNYDSEYCQDSSRYQIAVYKKFVTIGTGEPYECGGEITTTTIKGKTITEKEEEGYTSTIGTTMAYGWEQGGWDSTELHLSVGGRVGEEDGSQVTAGLDYTKSKGSNWKQQGSKELTKEYQKQASVSYESVQYWEEQTVKKGPPSENQKIWWAKDQEIYVIKYDLWTPINAFQVRGDGTVQKSDLSFSCKGLGLSQCDVLSPWKETQYVPDADYYEAGNLPLGLLYIHSTQIQEIPSKLTSPNTWYANWYCDPLDTEHFNTKMPSPPKEPEIPSLQVHFRPTENHMQFIVTDNKNIAVQGAKVTLGINSFPIKTGEKTCSSVGRSALTDEYGSVFFYTPSKITATNWQPSGLVGYWSGDNADATDSVGGNHGDIIGDTDFETGISGKAFHFDGDGDYITIPHSEDLNFNDGVTISAWIKPFDKTLSYFPPYSAIVAKSDFDGGGKSFGLWMKDDAYLHLSYWNEEKQDIVLESPRMGGTSYYHHVVAIIEPSAYNGMRIYLDGELFAYGPEDGKIFSTTSPLFIGSSGKPDPSGLLKGNEWYEGGIDEVQIYDRALTEKEIQGLAVIENLCESDQIETEPTILVTAKTKDYKFEPIKRTLIFSEEYQRWVWPPEPICTLPEVEIDGQCMLPTEPEQPDDPSEDDPPGNGVKIDPWIKDIAGLWGCEDSPYRTTDQEFIGALQWLIKKGIIIIPAGGTAADTTDAKIQPWIKFTACSWSNDQTTDQEFANAIQWLIENGIIKI